MTDDKRFTTVELPKPNKWGIWYDGAYLSTYQVCILLNEYVDVKKENEQLKAQLYCDSEEGVCSICKHHYLKKGNIFYISKCEKGHEECSKDALKHCKDFEIKECKND